MVWEAFGNDQGGGLGWGIKDLSVLAESEKWIDGYRWQTSTVSDPGGDIYVPNYILLDDTGVMYLKEWDETESDYVITLIDNSRSFDSLAILKDIIYGLETQI